MLGGFFACSNSQLSALHLKSPIFLFVVGHMLCLCFFSCLFTYSQFLQQIHNMQQKSSASQVAQRKVDSYFRKIKGGSNATSSPAVSQAVRLVGELDNRQVNRCACFRVYEKCVLRSICAVTRFINSRCFSKCCGVSISSGFLTERVVLVCG